MVLTENYKRTKKIQSWRDRGLIMDTREDYLTIYYHWLCSTNCEKCDKEYTEKNFKCMDHNHNTGEYRNILCFKCNRNIHDNLHKFNKSNVANVSYFKRRNTWRYTKYIDKKQHYKSFKTKEEAIAYKIEFESGGV